MNTEAIKERFSPATSVALSPEQFKESYLKLFNSLKERGLECPRLIVSDGAAGLTTAMPEVLPEEMAALQSPFDKENPAECSG